MKHNHAVIGMSPSRFYNIVSVMRTVHEKDLEWLDGKCKDLKEASAAIKKNKDRLRESVSAMDAEIRASTRRSPMMPADEAEDPLKSLEHTSSLETNFLRVAMDIVSGIDMTYELIYDMARSIRPGELLITRDGKVPPKGFNDLQHVVYEMEMNLPGVERFVGACDKLASFNMRVCNIVMGIERVMAMYHKAIVDRHSTQGVLVHGNPVATDVAITLYENIDANGEIADGRDPGSVSSYTVRKAEILIRALQDDFVKELMVVPDALVETIARSMRVIQRFVDEIFDRFGGQIDKVLGIVDAGDPVRTTRLQAHLNDLKNVSPSSVTYRDRSLTMTSEERFNLDFKNKTISEVVRLVLDPEVDAGDVIKYVLARKAELRKFFMEENSFYVCRIGHGNPFLGVAPGMLDVIPGVRPDVNMGVIRGSGFDEVREFAAHIVQTSKWHSLFLATSPSRTADKSNVLLVGPMGCGKSEVLRAVGGDKGSIGIFAQGSDFLTCWKGETEKNPKRLFEQALKLQKQSGKRVHILIDEVDAVLNDDREYGSTNLTLEFQILMDGIVQYPGISVWAATNNVERIPMPMIRRFNKVLVVGELSQQDRVEVLRSYVQYLPVGDITDAHWDGWAKQLDGATGDVLRKVADVVWRKKVTELVQGRPKDAEACVNFLNRNQKFKLSDFDEEERKAFKMVVGAFMRVEPGDVDASVRANLRNIGVLSEIKAARETYVNARKFLAHLESF